MFLFVFVFLYFHQFVLISHIWFANMFELFILNININIWETIFAYLFPCSYHICLYVSIYIYIYIYSYVEKQQLVSFCCYLSFDSICSFSFLVFFSIRSINKYNVAYSVWILVFCCSTYRDTYVSSSLKGSIIQNSSSNRILLTNSFLKSISMLTISTTFLVNFLYLLIKFGLFWMEFWVFLIFLFIFQFRLLVPSKIV